MAIDVLEKNIQQAKELLQQKIQEIANALPLSKHKVVRLEVPIEAIDILNWLAQQKDSTKIYWSNRDGSFEIGGIGLAYALHGTSVIDFDAIFYELTKYLSAEHKNLRFYGGVAFNHKSVDKEWEPFGSYRFVLPRFEIFRIKSQTFLACNLFGDSLNHKRIVDIQNNLETLVFKEWGGHTLPLPVSRRDEPTKNQWLKMTGQLMPSIMEKALTKIVLARKSIFEFEKMLDPAALAWRLKEISPTCYHFCLQVNDHTAFIGASPERLYWRQGKKIKTEALAGTRPRGGTQKDDQNFCHELLNSPKDLHEHQIVVHSIATVLEALCQRVSLDPEPKLLSLKSGQHLLTCLEGDLMEDIDDAAILTMLHPTPAVGGFPIDRAVKTINSVESFRRGWYAGPVGYIGFDEVEFAVGIRSGLITHNQLFLYAGAGLVSGSSPELEWEEIETKISNFIEIFSDGNKTST